MEQTQALTSSDFDPVLVISRHCLRVRASLRRSPVTSGRSKELVSTRSLSSLCACPPEHLSRAGLTHSCLSVQSLSTPDPSASYWVLCTTVPSTGCGDKQVVFKMAQWELDSGVHSCSSCILEAERDRIRSLRVAWSPYWTLGKLELLLCLLEPKSLSVRLCLGLYLSFLNMCGYFAFLCVCVPHLCLEPTETRRGFQFLRAGT